MARVQFKDIDETYHVRRIETRQELSHQDRCDRWYQCADIKEMTEQASAIVEFVKERGIESETVQRGLEMEIFDLRGLEKAVNVIRQEISCIVKTLILNYHKKNKGDSIGLSVFSVKATAFAKRLAWLKGWDDARKAKEECNDYFRRIMEDISRYEPIAVKTRKRSCLLDATEPLISSHKRSKSIDIGTAS